MNILINKLNKYNGNLCFSGESDYNYYIFECNHKNDEIVYSISPSKIDGICGINTTSYFICFSEEWIGLFQNGVLNTTFLNTAPQNFSQIEINNNGFLYGLDRNLNKLYKFSIPYTILWEFDLPDYENKSYGNIYIRNSDNTIFFTNNESVYTIRDDDTIGVITSKLPIQNAGEFSFSTGINYKAINGSIRHRMLTGQELDQSSSTSSSSTSSSSNSSSSKSSISSSSSTSSSTEIRTTSSSSGWKEYVRGIRALYSDPNYIYVTYEYYSYGWNRGIMAYTFNGSTFTYIGGIGGGAGLGISGDGTYIYANYTTGLKAYTFNGSSFTNVGNINDGGGTQKVWCDGTYIYLANGTDGLRAYTFNGSTFTNVGHIDDSDDAYGVWGDGTYIYTANYDAGLNAYTFNGSTFTNVGHIDNGGRAYSVYGDGTYIYLTTCGFTDGLWAYTFNGSSFTNVGHQSDGDGCCYSVWADDNYVYLANSADGLRVYTFNGSTFTNVGHSSGNVDTVYGDGTYVYFTEESGTNSYLKAFKM